MKKKTLLLMLTFYSIILSQTISYEAIADTLNSYTGTDKLDKAIEIGNVCEPWVVERIIMPELKYELAGYDLFSHYANEMKQDSLCDMFRVISLSFLKSNFSYTDTSSFINKRDLYNSVLLQLYQNTTRSDSLRSYALGKLLYTPNSETSKIFNYRENLLNELNSSNSLYRNASIKSLTRNFDELFAEADYQELSTNLIEILNSKKSDIIEFLPFFDLLCLIPRVEILDFIDELIVQNYSNGDFNEEVIIKLVLSKSQALINLDLMTKNHSNIEYFLSCFKIFDIELFTYSLRLTMRYYVKQNEAYLDLIRYSNMLEDKLYYLQSISLIGKSSKVELDKERVQILLNDEEISVKVSAIQVLPNLFIETELVDILAKQKSKENNADILELIAQYTGY
jgi:hypothetical protein